MSTNRLATGSAPSDRAPTRGGLFASLVRRLFGARRPNYPLGTGGPPIVDVAPAPVLRFHLGRTNNISLPSIAKKGEAVAAGGPLSDAPGAPVLRSPVRGSVTGVANAPDVRGLKGNRAVLVTAEADSSPVAYAPLDPRTAKPAVIRARIAEAGVTASGARPLPLAVALRPSPTLVVLVADREPLVSASAQLFRARLEDAPLAARLLARVTGSERVVLAVLPGQEADARTVAARENVEVLTLEPTYPAALEPLVAHRLGGATVVPLEAALAALDAVREGRVQDHKVLTVIGAGGKPVANLRVAVGARVGDVLAAAGLEPQERDKVVVGGPMQGFAQQSLDGGIDAGIDALMLIPASEVLEWTDAPCVHCGDCTDVCPVSMQVHLVGRYAEFGLFEQAGEHGAAACIECGLCAAVCPTRRPLLQLIRLAKSQLGEQAREREGAAAGEEEPNEERKSAAA